MTPSEIAESVFREKNSITAAINIMERQGIVRREPSPDDRRSVKVIITDKGWKEANQLNPIAQELSREVLSCIDKERVEALVSTMRTIRESLTPRLVRTTGNGKSRE
jgi:DNA-binding MarR family transcriptional regulator